jgi:hypothetical protein
LIVVVAGAPGGGKTTLLFLILAVRLHFGEPQNLLGLSLQPAPERKWIVLIEAEHGEGSTARKLVKSFRVLGLDNAGLRRVIIVARKAVKLGSPEWNDVVTLIKEGVVSDVAIDTIARVAPADGNDEQEQVAVYEALSRAIEAAPDDAKPIVWAAAHTRKGATGGLEDVSGSVQRVGQADSVLICDPRRSTGESYPRESSSKSFARIPTSIQSQWFSQSARAESRFVRMFRSRVRAAALR